MRFYIISALFALTSTVLAVGPNAKVMIPFADDSDTGPRRCLAVPANKNGAKVRLVNCTDIAATKGPSNTWTITKGSANGAETGFKRGPVTQIKIHGNKCLDVTDGRNQAGTNLQIWTCATFGKNKNQLWNVNLRSGLYTIQWASHTWCAGVVNKINASAPINTFKCDPDNTPDSYSANQVWRLFT